MRQEQAMMAGLRVVTDTGRSGATAAAPRTARGPGSTDPRRHRTEGVSSRIGPGGALETLVAAPVGIYRTEADGTCVFANDRWCAFAGLPESAALGHGWIEAIHPDDRELLRREWDTAIAEARDFRLDYRLRRPDGTTTWVAGQATAIPDSTGRPVGYVGTVTDISAAIATRDALLEERRFVDTVLDIAGSLVCVFDPDGRFLRFNRACEQLTGYTFAQIEGRTFCDFLIPAEEIAEVRESLGRLRAGEPPSANENNWLTRDGALRLIAWSDVCFFDEAGSLTHIVSTGTDITDERRARNALRGIEAVGTLLAMDGPTPDSMLAVLTTLASHMGYRYLALFMRDGETLRLGAQIGCGHLPFALDPAKGIIGRVLRDGEPAFVGDVTADADYVAHSPNVTCEIAIPLAGGAVTAGVLAISSTAEAPFTTADFRLAQTVAERISVAIQLGREQQALSERVRLFASLTGFARTVNSSLDMERLTPALLETIETVVRADAMALTVVDRKTGRYEIQAVRGRLDPAAIGMEITPGEGPTGRAIEDRTLVTDRIKRGSYSAPVRLHLTADEMSTAVVPLVHDDAVLGAISLGRVTDSESAFSALELEAIGLVAAQTALAISNARLLEEVSELAIRDALTGLFNRRHFDTSLDHIFAGRSRDRRDPQPLAAILFDLDHFGRFNKDYGHQSGDAVLRVFAGILLERFRSSDLVARYGGEEFIAILEDSTLADASRVADEVRRELENRLIVGPDGRELHATVSAGCAALDATRTSREALLQAADVGLSMAKRAGRNRIVSA
jgi:diguanylate cyclase (GGDEF)-like protein/PAS domain S-box-containing protein